MESGRTAGSPFDIVRRRFDLGATGELDVSVAETELATAESDLLAIDQERGTLRHRSRTNDLRFKSVVGIWNPAFYSSRRSVEAGDETRLRSSPILIFLSPHRS